MNTRNCFIFCVTLFFLLAATSFADIYLWEDSEGLMHITKDPPPTDAKLIKARMDPTPTPTHNVVTFKKDDADGTSVTDDAEKETVAIYTVRRTEEESGTEVDDFGNNAEWWQNYKKNLAAKIEGLEKEKADNSNRLRILNQGHRGYLQNDEADVLRKRQIDIENKIPLLKKELDEIASAVVDAGGYPGWVR